MRRAAAWCGFLLAVTAVAVDSKAVGWVALALIVMSLVGGRAGRA